MKYDAVIIGAGHNGLVCAAYLARAGVKVCLVERQPFVGGAAITREVWPGFRVSVASYWMSLLQPKIMLDLDLRNNGVEVISVPPSFHPFEDGRSLVYFADEAQFLREVAQFSERDAAAYPGDHRPYGRPDSLCPPPAVRNPGAIPAPGASRTSARPWRWPGG